MRADVANDFRNSSNAFCKLVWPIAQPLAGGGTLKPVEDVTASHTKIQKTAGRI